MKLGLPSRKVVFVAAFLLGVVTTAAFSAVALAPRPSVYPKLEVFAKVLSYVENDYVEPVDESTLVYGAIKGMLAPLDPHTAFLDPHEYQAMKDDTSGEFGGLGLEMAKKDGQVVVLAPLDDTPAARAGILAGDVVTAVDGESVATLSMTEVSTRLKGPPGTPVVLRLMRPSFTAPRDFPLVRAEIRVVSVDGRLLDGGIGYARIKSFQDGTDAAMGKLLKRLRSEAGGELKGLVLDLRNDPGGLLEEGVRVADRFIADGVIVTTKGRDGRNADVERAHEAGTEPGYPMVVLINGGTASASEVVAGALQDHARATLFGSPSFGKGSVQLVIDLDDGSGLKLTTARYYTPSGRSIQEAGIFPDVAVDPPKVEAVVREKDLAGHMSNDAPARATMPVPLARVLPAVTAATGDLALQAAASALRGWPAFEEALATARQHPAGPDGRAVARP